MPSQGKRLEKTDIFTLELVSGTAVVTSEIFNIGDSDRYYIWYKANSAGTPAVSLAFKVGYSKADDLVIATGKSAISVTDKVAHVDAAPILPMRYLQVVATGQGGNPADTTITVVLMHG